MTFVLNRQILKRIKSKISKMDVCKEEEPQLDIGTYYERHSVEPDSNLALHVFAALLKSYVYHPILWVLYSTCRYLRTYKYENNEKEITIEEYWPADKTWLGGNLVDVRDIIALDDSDKENTITALITLNSAKTHSLFKPGTFYIVPCQWLKRLVVQKNKFILAAFDFCCRQVLRRSDTTVVRCQSFMLDEKYHFDETYFHVGCGPCTNFFNI